MKKVLLLCLAIALILPVMLVPQPAQAADYLHIKEYKVSVNVRENNVYDITEVIRVDFETQRRGIIREIPVQNNWDTPEGRKRYTPIVSNVAVEGYNYTTYTESGIFYIRIGDADKYLTGEHTYTLSYSLDVGDDHISSLDFFYFNLIGPELNADIDAAAFTVIMPKTFDAGKMWSFTGGFGSKANNAHFEASGNMIQGYITQPLNPREAVTLQLDLPEGYFVGERSVAGFEMFLFILIGALVALSFILFIAFGKDGMTVQTVEFDAPDGLTSAEAGYIIDGSVDNRDAVSLIIYWADKGYLDIVEESQNQFTLRKLKDIPLDAKSFERIFFNGLFTGTDVVPVSSLKDTFYTTMESVKAGIKNSFSGGERRVFTKKSLSLQGLLSFFTALPVALCLLYANYLEMQDIIASAIFSAIGLIIVLPPVYMLARLMRSWRGQTPGKRTAKLVGSLILLGVAMIVFAVVMTVLYDKGSLGWTAILATIVLALLSVFMRKRTEQGLKWFGQLLGLKQFIETAEKDRIEMLVKENPNYFYRILPFAYVLGVTEIWAKNFERIGINPPPPSWYYGYNMNVFTTMWFLSSLNHSLSSMSTTFTSRPAPKGGSGGYGGGGFSGGGGFGGGGFSGGGFGGGGGGSW